jgi:hypothetical protein
MPVLSKNVNKLSYGVDDIRRTLKFMHRPGDTFELCIIGPHKNKSALWSGFAAGDKAVVAGWFTELDKASALAAGLDQEGAKAIYCTLNPCSPNLLARANQRLKAGVGRTTDAEILQLRNLLIDIDPARPSGISSSIPEHDAALAFAQEIKTFLTEQGWPEPLVGDSGNGGHLVYRLPDLPIEQNTLVKSVLEGLEAKYADENGDIIRDGIKLGIDQVVFNPARITKLYGTMTRKGDATPDRPHRRSRIISLPDVPQPVSLELLQILANIVKEVDPKRKQAHQSTGGGSNDRFDLHGYLARYEVKVIKFKEHMGGTLYCLDSCPFDPSHGPNDSAIGQTSDGKLYFQCFHDSCKGKTWHDARTIISGDDSLEDFKSGNTKRKRRKRKDEHGNVNTEAEGNTCNDRPSLYFADKGAYYFSKQTANGTIDEQLSNFVAKIVAEEIRDDGMLQQNYFVIEGEHQNGQRLFQISVPSQQFQSLNWVVANWGPQVIIFAGFAKKDHLRCAIQAHSKHSIKRVVYTHLGWRETSPEKWQFLFVGGAINQDGLQTNVEVDPGKGSLRNYILSELPQSKSDVKAAIKSSLATLNMAPPHISFSLKSATYRAPLNECFRSDTNIFVAGQSGSQKSSLVALEQAHFGANFDFRHFPGNWTATANALEKMAFLAKDCLFTIDDYCPSGTQQDIARLRQTIDRLFRGSANNAGRARMGADGTLKAEYSPRGVIIATGEDVPTGQSLLARTLILELKRDEVDLDLLTQAQTDAEGGLFTQAMAAYLRWLSARIGELKKSLPGRYRELRNRARRQQQWVHDKSPAMVADLMIGFEIFIRFTLDEKAISDSEAEQLLDECWSSLLKATGAQAEFQRHEDTASRFLTLIGAAIVSGRGHISSAKSNGEPPNANLWGWQERQFGGGENARYELAPRGDLLGWIDGDDLYLEPETAFAAVQKLAKDQGGSFPFTVKTTWKRLAEKGLLASTDAGQNTIRKRIGKVQRRVIHLKRQDIIVCPYESEEHGCQGKPSAETENCDWKFGNFEGSVTENDKNIEENQILRLMGLIRLKMGGDTRIYFSQPQSVDHSSGEWQKL